MTVAVVVIAALDVTVVVVAVLVVLIVMAMAGWFAPKRGKSLAVGNLLVDILGLKLD